jgi:hypothetical protein
MGMTADGLALPAFSSSGGQLGHCGISLETLTPIAQFPSPPVTMFKGVLFAAVAFQAAFVSQTMGHGNIILPKPTGDSDHVYYYGSPAGTIDMAEIVGDSSYGDYYLGVDEWFTENGISSLKEYITTYGSNISECGFTEKDGTAQPVPSDGYAEHDTLGNSHPGPCEIWCDDTRVFNSTNCQAEFAGESPTMIPIDVATCVASSEFYFYWLALHAQPWQVYINCVALDGTSSSASEASLTEDEEDAASTTTTTTTTTTTPATTTTAPATTTTAPATTTTAPATTTAAPSTTTTSTASSASTEAEADTTTTTTDAPATTTAAPATTEAASTTTSTTSTDKCSVRRKRN